MPTIYRDQVCPTCGQCLNSGVTQAGFDEMYARNERAIIFNETWKREASQRRKAAVLQFLAICVVSTLVSLLIALAAFAFSSKR